MFWDAPTNAIEIAFPLLLFTFSILELAWRNVYVIQGLPQTSTCSHLHGRRRLEPVSRASSPRHDRFIEVPHRLHHKVIYSDSSGAAFPGKYARAGSVYVATSLM